MTSSTSSAQKQNGRTRAAAHDIRPLTSPEQVAAAARVFRTAMVGIPFPAKDETAKFHEPGRGLGAFDGETIIGGAEAYTSWLTVPGGTRVPHAAVTHVGVLPSHTRRGVVTALLTRQLNDIAQRGEVVASLRASEAVIYERFGYGIATRSASYEVSRRREGLRSSVPGGSPVRLADPDDSDELLRAIYDKVTWVGSIGRYDAWWNGRRLWDAGRSGPRYLAVSGGEGSEDGYALYHPLDTSEWFTGRNRTIVITDLVAAGPAAYLGLVRHFATLDLTDMFRLQARPVDEPLASLFTDARSVRLLGAHDETWLRLVNVEAALSARTYRPGRDLVIGVSDELLPGNTGSYRIRAGGVERSDAEPEITVDVSGLASVYLGGQSWSTLALAGRAAERRSGTAADADGLFATPTAPFAGTGF